MAERNMRPPPNSDSHRTSEVRTTIRQSYNNMKDSCAVIISRRGRTKAKEDISRAPCNPDVASDATTSQNPAVASPSPVAMRPMVTSYALPDIGGMHQFEHDVDNAIMSRFNLVRSKLSPELAKHLNDRVRGYSKTNQFLCLHPALLGHNETDANVKIVVYCEECAMEEASLFFAQEWICALYKASEECPIGFEVVVEGPLRGLFGWLAAEVRIDNWHPDSPSSRIFVTQADKTRFATMGGVLLVRNHDGTDRFYGLTVQHVLSPRQEDEPNKDNIDDALSKGQEYDINTKSKIGVITASNSKQQYRKFDWALVELMQAFSSSVVTEQAPGTAPFWEVARPQPGIPVCLNNSPDIQGVFARWPGHAILPYSDTFVEVHMIRPSNADMIISGMSGSWVVASGNDSDRIVYGILVATDPQGMLWVVPMGDVLQEIQEELGAVQVLPFLKSPTAYQKSSDDKADRLRVGRDQTVSPTTNPEGSREINSKVHQTVANSPNREDDRENDSLRESTRMHNELSDMREDIKKNEEISLDTKSKCHYCGSLIHKEWSCPLKDDRKLRRLGRTEVTWTCEICHMGPQSDWNPTCPGCGHFRCNACEEYSQFVYDDS